MPIGGHKGSGLALVLGLRAGVLNWRSLRPRGGDFNADDESEQHWAFHHRAGYLAASSRLDVFARHRWTGSCAI